MKKTLFFRIIGAMLYDTLILFGLLMAATAILLPLNHGESIPQGTLMYQLYLVAVIYLYFDACWRKSGQTVGMLAWKIRLVSEQGKITRIQTLTRFCGAMVSACALGLGYILGWHDTWSKTKVVNIKP